jgi:hypothetical protein
MADDKSISAAQRGNPVPIILLIPSGRRPLKVELPPAVACWLGDELVGLVGASRPRRPVRLRRGRWQSQRRSR